MLWRSWWRATGSRPHIRPTSVSTGAVHTPVLLVLLLRRPTLFHF